MKSTIKTGPAVGFETVAVDQFRRIRETGKLLHVLVDDGDGWFICRWSDYTAERERFHRNWLEYSSRPTCWQSGLRLISTTCGSKRATLSLTFNNHLLWCTNANMDPAVYSKYWREVSHFGELRGIERNWTW